MSEHAIKILAISGSLRRRSYSRALLRAAGEAAPNGVEIEVFDMDRIPLYNGDVEERGDPEAVADPKRRIQVADAVLIATPQYNGSIPGVLKNALDWASRPARRSALRGKPAAVISSSPGAHGATRAQAATRQVLEHIGAHVLPGVHPAVDRVDTRFDGDGVLRDEPTRRQLRELIDRLAATDRCVQSELAQVS